MTANIFRVRTELELDEILENNKYKLISVVFSTNNSDFLPTEINLLLKKLLKRVMAQKYKDAIFVYVNLSDFNTLTQKYIGSVNKSNVPVAQFYWDFSRIATIEKLGSASFVSVFEKLMSDIEKKGLVNNNESDISKPTTPPVDPEIAVVADPPAKPDSIDQPASSFSGMDSAVINQQLVHQKKMSEIEKLRTVYEINELLKVKKLKEDEEDKRKPKE